MKRKSCFIKLFLKIKVFAEMGDVGFACEIRVLTKYLENYFQWVIEAEDEKSVKAKRK